MFGPPLAFWTGRFESKHRVSKNISESAKNFINISWTVSNRHQMRMASIYYRGMFETKQFILPEKTSKKEDIQKKGDFWDKIKEFMGDDDLLCNEIIVNDQKYETGDLTVMEILNGGNALKVGLLKLILVREAKVFFINKQYFAVKNYLGYYETNYVETEAVLKNSSTLADFKPLIMRGTPSKFLFVLHHHVSFDYS